MRRPFDVLDKVFCEILVRQFGFLYNTTTTCMLEQRKLGLHKFRGKRIAVNRDGIQSASDCIDRLVGQFLGLRNVFLSQPFFLKQTFE